MGSGGIVTGTAFYFSAEGYKRTLAQGQSQPIDDEKLDELIEMMREAGVPVDGMPPEILRETVGQLMAQGFDLDTDAEPDLESDEEAIEKMEDSVVVYFDSTEEVDPTYLEWLDEHKLKYPSREAVPTFHRIVKGSGPRPLNLREV